jgi:hypothetical protein
MIDGCKWQEFSNRSKKHYWVKDGVVVDEKLDQEQQRNLFIKPEGFEGGVYGVSDGGAAEGGAPTVAAEAEANKAAAGEEAATIAAEAEAKAAEKEDPRIATAQQGNAYFSRFADPHTNHPLPAMAEVVHNSVDARATKVIITKASAPFAPLSPPRPLCTSSAYDLCAPLSLRLLPLLSCRPFASSRLCIYISSNSRHPFLFVPSL